jgi:NCAIR mutase (PurE)-related protein
MLYCGCLEISSRKRDFLLVRKHFHVDHDTQEQLDLLAQILSEGAFQSGSLFHGAGASHLDPAPGGVTGKTGPAGETLEERIEIRPDPARERRKGVPEVIFGATKTTSQVLAMAHSLLEGTGRALISRVRSDTLEAIRQEFSDYPLRLQQRSLVIYQPDYIPVRTGGRVGVLSAGTSDIPAAEEAALLAEEMGCQVTCVYDVGVAGLHRLLEPLRDMLNADVDVIIVAAGMDGALPSVVAGLVPVPVIGLPTAVGYGMGGNGLAALLSMLQTCAPGLTVVNIDNGVGAGITAALIANRVAWAALHRSQ